MSKQSILDKVKADLRLRDEEPQLESAASALIKYTKIKPPEVQSRLLSEESKSLRKSVQEILEGHPIWYKKTNYGKTFSHECPHDPEVMRPMILAVKLANGSSQYRWHCNLCNSIYGPVLANEDVRNAGLSPRLHVRTMEQEKARRERVAKRTWQLYQEHREIHEREEKERRGKEYQAYLGTNEWRKKRELVLNRAKGVCEGCGQRPATQVHHRTYERIFKEMLFDLVAICRECHAAIHGEKP